MYVVCGASGKTGTVATLTLLASSVPVRVIVRDPAKGRQFQEKGAEVVVAEIGDTAAISKAFENAKVVYLFNPPSYEVDIMQDAKKNVGAYANAIKNSGVKKIVLLSSVGAQLETGLGNIFTARIYEQILRTLNISVAFLRASSFMENYNSIIPVVVNNSVLPSFLPIDGKIAMISTRDIGRVAAEIMLQEWEGERVIELQGPAFYSPEDVAAFGNVLGKSVKAVPVEESLWRSYLPQNYHPATLDYFMEMTKGFATGHIVHGSGETIKGKVDIQEAAKEMLKEAKVIKHRKGV